MNNSKWGGLAVCLSLIVFAGCKKKSDGGGGESTSGGGVTNHTLTLKKEGTGTGRVQSSAAGVDCGSTCLNASVAGTEITLTATPDTGMVFAGWSGGNCSGTGSCIVKLDTDKTVVATFNNPKSNLRSLVINKNGAGAGRVTSTPSGVDCGFDCSEDFTVGTVVTLASSPDSFSDFSGWGGACSGAGDCSVTMNSATSVSASFLPASLNGSWKGTGKFTVSGVLMSSFSVTGILTGTYCTSFYTVTHTGSTLISNHQVSSDGGTFKYSGTFYSKTFAMGSYSYTDNYCDGTDSRSWSSTKETPGTAPSFPSPFLNVQGGSIEEVIDGFLIQKRIVFKN